MHKSPIHLCHTITYFTLYVKMVDNRARGTKSDKERSLTYLFFLFDTFGRRICGCYFDWNFYSLPSRTVIVVVSTSQSSAKNQRSLHFSDRKSMLSLCGVQTNPFSRQITLYLLIFLHLLSGTKRISRSKKQTNISVLSIWSKQKREQSISN